MDHGSTHTHSHSSTLIHSARDKRTSKVIELTVCSSVKLGGLLQNTLGLGVDQDTKVFSLHSDYNMSHEFRSSTTEDCNGWFNALDRIFDASAQVELTAMADIDEVDMRMRFRHARLWALGRLSAPEPLPRSQWAPTQSVSFCNYCEDQFANDFAKHHCRLCGDVYCKSHSKMAKDLDIADRPFRVCVWCYLIWRDYAQGIMDNDREKMNLLGDRDTVDIDDEMEALRDYRRDKAKQRQAAAAAVANEAISSPKIGRRLSVGLSSLVTKFSDMFQGRGGGSPGSRRGSAALLPPVRERGRSATADDNNNSNNPFGDDNSDSDSNDNGSNNGSNNGSSNNNNSSRGGGGNGVDDVDDDDDLLATVDDKQTEEEMLARRRGMDQQLKVLDNLLTVSTSHSEWMKLAEKSLTHEEDNYLDLACEGW